MTHPRPTVAELWHAAGRAAADPRKRLLALGGVVWSGPALLLGSFLVGAFTLSARAHPLTRPAAYLLEPLTAAYGEDRDGAVLLYLLVQALLLGQVWGYFGGALARRSVVDLSGAGREPGRAALAHARRHLPALLGAPVLMLLSVAVPLGLAWLATLLARLPGFLGGVGTPLAVVLVGGLSLVAVVGGSFTAACGFLSRSAVAADGADLFDAVSRPYTFALAGLPRLVGLRLLFLCGVLLGAAWRLLWFGGAALLGAVLLEQALSPERWQRLTAVLGAYGTPPDAARLGLSAADVAAAAAVALVAALLALAWLSDLVSRIACARAAVYLLLRRAVEHVPVGVLADPPREQPALTAEAAGFDEVARVEAP